MQLIVRYPDARCIVRGLEKGKAEIAESVPVLLAMRTARVVPVRLWAEAFRLVPERRP